MKFLSFAFTLAAAAAFFCNPAVRAAADPTLAEPVKSRERKVRCANGKRARSDAETEVWGACRGSRQAAMRLALGRGRFLCYKYASAFHLKSDPVERSLVSPSSSPA